MMERNRLQSSEQSRIYIWGHLLILFLRVAKMELSMNTTQRKNLRRLSILLKFTYWTQELNS